MGTMQFVMWKMGFATTFSFDGTSKAGKSLAEEYALRLGRTGIR